MENSIVFNRFILHYVHNIIPFYVRHAIKGKNCGVILEDQLK